MILDLLNYNNTSLNDNIFKFRTNTTTFKIKYNIKEPVRSNFAQFGLSAREGLLLVYKFIDEYNWYNLDAYARKSEVFVKMTHITDGERFYDVIVYGPNLTSLSKLDIEIPDEFKGEIIKLNSNRKMIILGGLNTFGIGCTSSGVMFSNILQRKFNAEVKKIAFNSHNYLDKVYNYLTRENIPKIDVAILEIDSSRQSEEYVERYLDKILDALKDYAEKIICWLCIPPSKNSKKQKALKILKRHDVIFSDMSFIYSSDYEDMCTYSYNFINDSANMFIYKKLSENLKESLNWII